MSERATLDVRGLPRYAFGAKSILWWGTMGLVAIEGTMFAILIATYFYLRTRSSVPRSLARRNSAALWVASVMICVGVRPA